MAEKDMGMDRTDELQELAIQRLRLQSKVMAGLFALVMLGGVALFAYVMESRRCPHPACEHYVAPRLP